LGTGEEIAISGENKCSERLRTQNNMGKQNIVGKCIICEKPILRPKGNMSRGITRRHKKAVTCNHKCSTTYERIYKIIYERIKRKYENMKSEPLKEMWKDGKEYAEGITLKVWHKQRIPLECNFCKTKNIPTEKFIGFRGHELYICSNCIKKCYSLTEGCRIK